MLHLAAKKALKNNVQCCLLGKEHTHTHTQWPGPGCHFETEVGPVTCLPGHFSHPEGGARSHLPTSFSPLQSPTLRELHHLCSNFSSGWPLGPGHLRKFSTLPSPGASLQTAGLVRRPQAVCPSAIPAVLPILQLCASLFFFLSLPLWVSVPDL